MRNIQSVLSLIIKILVIAAVIAIGVSVYTTCSGGSLIQKIDKSLPLEDVAPIEVITATKIYQTQSAVLNPDGSVTMNKWYERVGGKWVLQKKEITLPPQLRPVIRRR